MTPDLEEVGFIPLSFVSGPNGCRREGMAVVRKRREVEEKRDKMALAARTKKEQALLDALESAARDHGFELVDARLGALGATRVVRVYLDRPDAAEALSVDALAEANAWVSPIVESIDPVPGRYALEVSSPGIDRPLRLLAHFARFVGETVQLETEPLAGRRKWTGELVGLEAADGSAWVAGVGESEDEDALVLINIEEERQRIPFAKIKKAHVKGRVDFSKPAGPRVEGAQGENGPDERD
jgi:ribosome maturation factor RimP